MSTHGALAPQAVEGRMTCPSVVTNGSQVG